jgi:hypothetical protein
LRPPLDALPADVLRRIAGHPLPFDAVRGMHRDGRITERLRDELVAALGGTTMRSRESA